MLLGHSTDSVDVLHEAISAGRIAIRGAPGESGLALRLRGQLVALFVPAGTRPGLFADPVPLPGPASPVTNSSPSSAAGRSAAIPRGPPGLHK